jgi:multiple sugar transport system permease protein
MDAPDWRDWVKRQKENCDKHNLPVTQAHAHYYSVAESMKFTALDWEDNIGRIKRDIEAAGMCQVPWLVIHPDSVNDEAGYSRKKSLASETERFKRFGELAAKYGTGIAIGLCLLMLSPFIWMIGASLKKEADVMKQGVGLFPTYWYPQNYLRVLGFAGKTNYHFLQGYWNSIKVAAISALVAGISSCLAGYAFAKLKFRGSNVLFLLYLSQMMIPSQLTLIPRFVIFSAIGLVNTHWALILPKIVAVSATFMMRQAFLGTSEELREAAKIDGASEFRIFYQIMVPIIIPTIAAVCTTQFVSSWNSSGSFRPDIVKKCLFQLTVYKCGTIITADVTTILTVYIFRNLLQSSCMIIMAV